MKSLTSNKIILNKTCKFCNNKFTTYNTNRKFCNKRCTSANRRILKPLQCIIYWTKYRAKKAGIEFTITVKDLEIPEYCPILNIPIFKDSDVKNNPNSPSIDRIDPTKGYVKDNVQIISWRANDLKKNGTLEEFVKLVKWMENNK